MCRLRFEIIAIIAVAFFTDSNTENTADLEFVSHPTTVKARENNTVLLPCYLNTLSNGKYKKYSFYRYFNKQ